VTFARTVEQRLSIPVPDEHPDLRYRYPPTDGWTWQNQGSASLALLNRGHVWTQPAVAANNLIGRTRAYTNPMTVVAELVNESSSLSAFTGVGLGFRSATGQILICYSTTSGFTGEYWSNVTTFTGSAGSGGAATRGSWMKAEDNGTNLIISYSATGFDNAWTQILSVARTTNLTGGPTSVGMWGRDNNGARSWVLRRWSGI
jgi:hypothetical protein